MVASLGRLIDGHVVSQMIVQGRRIQAIPPARASSRAGDRCKFNQTRMMSFREFVETRSGV